VLAQLQLRGFGTLQIPQAFDDAVLARIHSSRHLDFLKAAWH